MSRQLLLTGFTFSILWASASVAGKFGLLSVEPLVLFNIRFLGAGVLLLSYSLSVDKAGFPHPDEWKSLAIFGALNTTLYLGLFVLALKSVTPGITTLAVALNPVIISVLTTLWLKQNVTARQWLGIALGFVGILAAALPLLKTSHATVEGLVLLFLSQLAYSVGAVYYSSVQWKRNRVSINGWQVLLGGAFLLPFTILFHKDPNSFDLNLVLSLAWLIVPVSIIAVQLWLRLLKADPVNASLWLFLCPVFGFVYARVLFDEPITLYTGVGTGLVLLALYLGQSKKERP